MGMGWGGGGDLKGHLLGSKKASKAVLTNYQYASCLNVAG